MCLKGSWKMFPQPMLRRSISSVGRYAEPQSTRTCRVAVGEAPPPSHPVPSPARPDTHHQHGEEGGCHQGALHDDEVDAAGKALQHRLVEAGQGAVTQGP